jgi:hypothetical protein
VILAQQIMEQRLPSISIGEGTRSSRLQRRDGSVLQRTAPAVMAAVCDERSSRVIRATRQLTGAHMKDQSTADFETLRVRRLEVRDLKDAGETFPGGMVHVHASPADSTHSFFEEAPSGRQNAWVAEADDRLIGMAVISIESQALARLMYLHVTGDSVNHERAARALAEIAIRDAWEGGYLKLVVHTRIPANHVIEYMHDLGFEFARTQSTGGQCVIEFYRNLYEPPGEPSSGVGAFR